jgi:hypothetical protein
VFATAEAAVAALERRLGQRSILWTYHDGDGARPRDWTRTRRIPVEYDSRTNWADLAASYRKCVDLAHLQRLAARLSLDPETLRRFGIGWSPAHGAWSFVMRNGRGNAVGVHLRRDYGQKRSVKGSRLGLFLPDNLEDMAGPLLLPEGLSDAATLVEMGFAAGGRPSCDAGKRDVVDLVRRLEVKQAVVVADSDPPGRRGAANLASVLRLYVKDTRIIAPPPEIKDVRSWYIAGATKDDLIGAIAAAPARRLVVRQGGGA